MKKTKNINIHNFPAELHAEFKYLCELEPTPINRKIVELVTEWVGDHQDLADYAADRQKEVERGREAPELAALGRKKC